MPGPPRRYPKQVSPALAPGTSARIDAASQASGDSPSALIRKAIDAAFAGPIPRIVITARPTGAQQRMSCISEDTWRRVRAAADFYRVTAATDVMRWAVEQTYPPDGD